MIPLRNEVGSTLLVGESLYFILDKASEEILDKREWQKRHLSRNKKRVHTDAPFFSGYPILRKIFFWVLLFSEDSLSPHRVWVWETSGDGGGYHSRDRGAHRSSHRIHGSSHQDLEISPVYSAHYERCRNTYESRHCPCHRIYARETNHHSRILSLRGVLALRMWEDLHLAYRTIPQEVREMSEISLVVLARSGVYVTREWSL